MAFEQNAPDADPSKITEVTYKGQRIILCKSRGNTFSPKEKLAMERGIYPEKKKVEAVTLYCATGNFKLTAELSGVTEHTLREWRKKDWFQALLREIREENNEKIDAKFSELVEGALEQLQDRIKNGDYTVLRDGTIMRKPVSAKDLSIVAAINIDKRQLLRGLPTSRTENVGQIEDKTVGRLEKLAETFENLARFGRKPRVIEAKVTEIDDAVQVSSPTSMDVRQQSGDGQAVGEGNPEGQEVAPEGK
jgi:transposase-like protein